MSLEGGSSTGGEPLPPKAKEDFLFLSEIGEGSYSTVHLASERSTSRKFAVKVCFKKKIIREKKVQQIFRERDILRLLSTPENSNPFIVRLFCTFQDQDSLYFVLTYAERKDLLSRLKVLKKFTLEQCQFTMAELWNALDHIHSLHVVHRDVKPENVLLRHDGHILLSDFGCAKRLDLPTTENGGEDGAASQEAGSKLKRRCSFVGTAQYVSPEVLNGAETTAACDWWAFGVILFELLAGKRPFCAESEYLMYQRILRLGYQFPDDFPSECARELVQQLLVISTSERIGSPGRKGGGPLRIKEHRFFVGLDWTAIEQQKSPLFPADDEQHPLK